MAVELVLGCQMDPRTVMTMPASEVKYWYQAALKRQRQLEERMRR